ncbi:MAG: TolC family protein [Hyphomicrobiaceae bacterium]
MAVASRAVSAIAAIAIGLSAQPWAAGANAQSLEETLATTYRNNPELEAARARLRSTDESVPLAWSGYHPIFRADAIAARRRIETTLDTGGVSGAALGLPQGTPLGSTTDAGVTSPVGWQVTGRQVVFDGFKTKGAIARANETVRAGRAELAELEARVLLDAMTAHLDIVRDQRVLGIRRKFVDLLERERASIKRRRQAEEATNADVAITEARLADARGQLASAQANLQSARARYAKVVGGEADAPKAAISIGRKLLPASLSSALEQTRSASPAIAAARHLERAALHAVTEADASLLPQVTIEGSYSEIQDPSTGVSKSSEGLIYGRISVPIYEAGVSHIRARQSRHERIARSQDIRKVETASMAATRAGWQGLVAARAQIRASEERQRAAEQALRGIRREAGVGARTQIDILNAEQEVLSARIANAIALRDRTVAEAALLKAIGRLDAAGVANVEILYDAAGHLDVAMRKWIGLSVEQAGAWKTSVGVGAPEKAQKASVSSPLRARKGAAVDHARPARGTQKQPLRASLW